VVAALLVAAGLSNPLRGRLVDVKGQGRTLVPLAFLHVSSLATLVVLSAEGAATWALVVTAVVAGASPAPVMSSLRALWRDLVPGSRLGSAYALHAVVTELMFVGSPLLALALVAAFSAELAVLALASIEFAGVVAFAATPASRGWRSESRAGGGPGSPLRAAGMRTLAVAALPYGMVFGALDVAAPALADRHGAAEISGVAVAALALGGVAGGLAYGARQWPLDLPARYLVALSALAAMLALSALSALSGGLPVFPLTLAVVGLLVAPVTTMGYSLLDRVAPRGTATEATAWMVLGNGVGGAAGASVAGIAVEAAGVTLGILVASAGALSSGLVVLTRLGTLGQATLRRCVPPTRRAGATALVPRDARARAPRLLR
jgi:MFS family permease